MIKETLWMGWVGLGWMVIIGRRQSKSTFGANKDGIILYMVDNSYNKDIKLL